MICVCVGIGAAANALTVYTNYALFSAATGSRTTIDFDSSTGPVTVLSGVTFTAVGAANLRSSSAAFALSGTNILDVNQSSSAGGIGAIMTLPSAQGCFGFWYFDSQFSNSVTMMQGNVATTFNLQGSAPFQWQFFGVTSGANDITAARVDIDPADYVPLDDVTFGLVPEPATGLALLGLIGAYKARRRGK